MTAGGGEGVGGSIIGTGIASLHVDPSLSRIIVASSHVDKCAPFNNGLACLGGVQWSQSSPSTANRKAQCGNAP